MLDFQAARWLIAEDIAPQAGNDHPTGIPTGVFETSDGHINIAAAGGGLYVRMCTALGREELVSHDDYKSGGLRSKNRKALNAEIASVTRHKTSAEWIEIMNEAGVPCGPINTIDKTFADPQVQALGIAKPVDHPRLGEIRVVGQAVNLERTPQPAKMRRPTAELSEHTEEILTGLGFGTDEIVSLRERKVI